MKKALLVTNLTARSVSPRLKQVIQNALSADLELELADTSHRNHATELARKAATSGLDLVIAFGGDGTMNEVVNGLAGTDTALAILPGGMANVFCRSLGIPVDIVEATGYLLNRLKNYQTRSVNIGHMDGRYFVMSCGIGLDAATVRRTEANPSAKRKFRDWFFLWSAVRTAVSEYRGKDPYIHLSAGDVSEEVVLAVISNIGAFTFFKNWQVTITPQARIEEGLDVFSMRRFPITYIPGILISAFKTGSHVRHKHASYVHNVTSIALKSTERPFPVQVDGEFVGERTELAVDLVQDGLKILD